MALMYIAGPIRDTKNYREKFMNAQIDIASKGWGTFNPVLLPSDTSRRRAMGIDLAAVLNSDAVFALPGHEKSEGAMIEIALADYLGIPVYKNPDDVPDLFDIDS